MPQDRTDRDAQANPKPAAAPEKPILKKLPATPKLKHRILPPVDPVPDGAVPATAPVVHPEPVAPAPAGSLKQKAMMVTREIQKKLALIKKTFLRVVILIGQVRDEKLYAELGYATIEAYAAAQLGLKRTALLTYLRVYDWLRQFHPAWLEPGAKVRIADLNDADDLIWIDKELARESLPANKKAALQELKRKALTGTLLRSEVRAYKAHGNRIAGGNRAYLAKLRHLRKRGAELEGLPDGVITHLDAAIEILQRAVAAYKKAKPKASKRATAPK